MLDVLDACNITLLCVLAVLIYKNRDWKHRPIFMICFVLILIAVVLTVIFLD